MKISDVVNTDPETLGGTPVFKGTRVPIESLFWHLEKGITVDEFLEDFPSVTKDQALALLEIAGKLVASKKLDQLYEAVG
jgi:uncharacterized protein (DUF433 family)